MSESSCVLSHCDRKRSAHSTSGVRTIPDSMMRPANSPSQKMHQFSQYGLLRNSETLTRANMQTLSFDVTPCRYTHRRSRVESGTSSGPDPEPNVAPIRGPINGSLLGGNKMGLHCSDNSRTSQIQNNASCAKERKLTQHGSTGCQGIWNDRKGVG